MIYGKLWPSRATALWRYAHTLPVLAPPLWPEDEAFLYTRPDGGTTTSGIITTSLDGSFINAARVAISVAAACGWTVDDAWARFTKGDWYALFQGDDTVLVVPPTFNQAVYEETSLSLGYQSRVSAGVTFLMRYYDLDRQTSFPLISRAFQQTVWNEHGGRSRAIELQGLVARTAGLSLHPGANVYWQLVSEGSASLDSLGMTQPTSHWACAERLRDPDVQAELIVDLKKHHEVIRQWTARASSGRRYEQSLMEWLATVMGTTLRDMMLPTQQVFQNNAASQQAAWQEAIRIFEWAAVAKDDRGPSPLDPITDKENDNE
jgi:hypothetical protein